MKNALQVLISNSSDKPIYEQIMTQIQIQIMDGSLEAGTLLPSLRVLAKELRISVITTKRAYEELERSGFIETVAGKGTFVAKRNREVMREQQLKQVEDHLRKAVDAARKGAISLQEMQELLLLLDTEEK